MGFDVSNLTDFTEKATEILRQEALFTDEVARYSLETGIQHEKYLNYVEAGATVQAGGCGLTADGSAKFTERKIKVVPLAFRQKFCEEDLRKKGFVFKGGTNTGKLPVGVEEALTIEETQSVAEQLAYFRWVGDTAGGDLVDGWVTIASADADVIAVAIDVLDSNNIDNMVAKMIDAITPEMYARFKKTKEKFTLHIPMSDYKLYKRNRLDANLFREQNTKYGTFEMDIFGEEDIATIKAETELTGSNKWVLTMDSNLTIGTDEVGELSAAKFIYNEETDYILYKADMKYGAQYKYSKELILGTVATS